MKTRLLGILMLVLVFAYSSNAQVYLMGDGNGSFETGTTDGWRIADIGDQGAFIWITDTVPEGVLGSYRITDDSYVGDYAFEVTWPAAGKGMAEQLFDKWHTPIACTAGKDYIFKAAAYATAGEGNVLRMAIYFFGEDGVTGVAGGDLADQTWVLGSFYEEHEWTVTAPADAKFMSIGFRVFGVDGDGNVVRWPAVDVVTMIDDIQLWEGSVGTDMFELTTAMTGTGTGEIEIYPLSPSADGKYYESTQVSATVIPTDGHNFVAWTGDNIVGTDTTTASVIMDQNQSISAEITAPTSVKDMDEVASNLRNYPNPFNSSTTFSYTLSKNSNVTLSIYDVTGSLVNVLVSQYQSTGDHTITWDGTSSTGTILNQGIYFGKLDISNGKSQNIKILLNK